MLLFIFDGRIEKILVLIVGLRVIVFIIILFKFFTELKDIVFFVFGFEGEIVVFFVILDWFDVLLFWFCRGKKEEVKFVVGVFNDIWIVVVIVDDDDDDIDSIKDGDDNKDDVIEVDIWRGECIGINDEIVLDG